MKAAKFFTVLIVFLSVIAGGCLVPPGTVQPGELPKPLPPADLANPKLAMASAYKPTAVSFTPSSPAYSLPLDLSKITNTDQIKDEFNLNSDQEALLQENSFVVIPWRGNDIVQPYLSLKGMEVPIFVTSDTLLHLYHIQFNEILKRIEEEDFYNQLIDMTQAMLKTAEADYQSFKEPALKEAARRNVAYFAVALSLLQTPSKTINFDIPGYVKNEVSQEINNIEAHQGFSPSSIFNTDADCRCDLAPCYCEDYSQYVPRGHYTRSDILKSYFKSMMWYGRMAFLLKGGLVSEEDAKIATIQASLISTELPGVKVADYTAKDVWDRIYAVTSFFVGTADDLTPYEYLNALNKVFGQEFAVNQLTDEAKMLAVKAELAAMRNPEIYGGSGVCVIYPPITKDKLYECLSDTKGMRFMGQRFVPDSYIFQNLVTPAVGMYVGKNDPFTMCTTMLGPARCFPRGLDVMTVLGCDRAYQILLQEGDTEYKGTDTSYDKQLAQLKDEFASFTENDWHRNLYWSWLYALKPLTEKYGKGYPAFMQTDAWQEKELNTSLASWAELRHDTILYAKQSYTPMVTSAPPGPPVPQKPLVGYIEPVPDFYARMLDLTKMTREGLSQLGVLSSEENGRLLSLEAVLNTSLRIAVDEVEGKKLTQEDYDFIGDFGNRLESIITGVESEGKETTVVADVHTDTNTAQVLEEGVGYVDLILVAYKVPDGRIIIGAGPTLSYYEFKQPMDNRLTDEQWKQMLQSGQAPSRPAWTDSFFQP